MSSDQSASSGMAEWIEWTGRRQRSGARAPPGRTGKVPVTLSKASLIMGGRSRVFESIVIGRSGFLWRAKLSFHCDCHSTSCFKIFSSFQKVNSLPMTSFKYRNFFKYFKATALIGAP
jgi:hypothetical protein